MSQKRLLRTSSTTEKRSRSDSWRTESAVLASNDAIARWCQLVPSDQTETNDALRVVWDKGKVQAHLTSDEAADQLFLRNLVHGTLVTGRLWPILLERSSDPLTKFRTLEYLHSISNADVLPVLDDVQVTYLCIGVRDLWLANARGLLTNQAEQQLLHRLLNLLDEEALPGADLHGLAFSFCPTRNRRVLRYAERLDELLNDAEGSDMLDCIAQVRLGDLKLYAVWLNAADLSYHNLESIVPLDRALAHREDISLELNDAKVLHPAMAVFECNLGGSDRDLLSEIDELGLYSTPANSATRGGSRFVFSSVALSTAITNAVRRGALLRLINDAELEGIPRPPPAATPAKKRKGAQSDAETELSERLKQIPAFVMCNYVFRFNRFAPGDGKFERHLRKHISKYTAIIYLSDGEGAPALKIESNKSTANSVALKQLRRFQVVVFDQRYEHEGKPFISGDKVFLRTELIFEEKRLQHEPVIAPLFASATYLSLESALQPDLARHAHEAYERANRAHWGGRIPAATDLPVLLKRWGEGQVFATNGSDCFFPCDTSSDLARQVKLAALVALLDHLNGAFPAIEAAEQADDAAREHWRQRHLQEHQRRKDAGVGSRREAAIPREKAEHKQFREQQRETLRLFKRDCNTKVIKPPAGLTVAALHQWVMSSVWQELGGSLRWSSVATPITRAEKEAWVNNAIQHERTPEIDAEELPERTRKGKRGSSKEDDSDDEELNTKFCCPDHGLNDDDANESERFRPWLCRDVVDCYRAACEYTRKKIVGASLLLMNHKMHFDEEAVHLSGDKVMFLGSNADGPFRFNFASCWNADLPTAFIEAGKHSIIAPQLLLPPIQFVLVAATDKSAPGIHLLLDLFKNDWVLYADKQLASSFSCTVPVPAYEKGLFAPDKRVGGFQQLVNPHQRFNFDSNFRFHRFESDTDEN